MKLLSRMLVNAKVEVDSLAGCGLDQDSKFRGRGIAENTAQQRASQCAGASQAPTARSDRAQHGVVLTTSIFF